MSDVPDWLDMNQRYMETALAWLRMRLGRLAACPVPVPPGTQGWLPSWLRTAKPVVREVRDEDIDRVAVMMASNEGPAGTPVSADNESPEHYRPALMTLAEQLGLTPFERSVLLLCTAMELDPDLAALCARGQRDPERAFPTFALALALFDDPHWSALSPERPLRYWRLLEIHQPGAQPLNSSPLRADERIVNFLSGWNYLDDRLALLATMIETGGNGLSASQAALARDILHMIRPVDASLRPMAVQMLGVDAESKQLVARRLAADLGLLLYRLPVQSLPLQPGELVTFCRLWQRESRLLPLALYLDARELEPAGSERAAALELFLARTTELLVFLDVREARDIQGRPSQQIEISQPTALEQKREWARVLGTRGAAEPGHLAGQFTLNLPSIQQIARAGLAEEVDQSLGERLWSVCLSQSRPRLDALAQRIEPKATMEDLVLPEAEADILEQIAGQILNRSTVYDDWGFRQRSSRGLGVSVLFAGESGTGKTLAAEVLANRLHLDLYRIDLSSVVSKYIGETEKNLRRLFDAAEDGGAILFFDEADALFGKRSEVKDSHDRFANIEINYLLQRIESYRGLAILATNFKSALDPAFLRRLRFIVKFPFPGAKERRLIWRRAFPRPDASKQITGVPIDLSEQDYEQLGQLTLSGANIQAIAMKAAFLAASERPRTGVTVATVVKALCDEFRKLGKPIPTEVYALAPKPRLMGATA